MAKGKVGGYGSGTGCAAYSISHNDHDRHDTSHNSFTLAAVSKTNQHTPKKKKKKKKRKKKIRYNIVTGVGQTRKTNDSSNREEEKKRGGGGEGRA